MFGAAAESVEHSFDTLANRLHEVAFLNAGVLITLDDERTGKDHEDSVRRSGRF